MKNTSFYDLSHVHLSYLSVPIYSDDKNQTADVCSIKTKEHSSKVTFPFTWS